MGSTAISAEDKRVLTGNILLFYAYDIGDEIDLDIIKHKELLPIRSVSVPPFFKNYHRPLSFHMPAEDFSEVGQGNETDCIMSRLHHFGALSFCYKVPFEATFDELKHMLVRIHKEYKELSMQDARRVFERVLRVIRKPRFYNVEHSYYVVQLDIVDDLSAEEFRSSYGSEIATLLRLETGELADYQTEAILSGSIEYFGQDFIVIDSEAACIYDNEYFESLEFFELTNIQLLELQFFDRILYMRLNYFYAQEAIKVPWRAYVPMLQSWIDTPITQLAKLRVDISVITEQLESSIKLAGDAYYMQLYSMLVEKLSLQSWRDSIDKKLHIIQDIYGIYQTRLQIIREELLTVVIILLIAIEMVTVFIHR